MDIENYKYDIIEYKKKDNYSSCLCSNCGKYGHKYKFCTEPITSMGVILVKINDTEKISEEDINMLYDNSEEKINITTKIQGIRCSNNFEMNSFSLNKNKIKFLMIQRKHTLGYCDFIRGRYNLENIDGIIFLFQQMTQEEINKIGSLSFDELWDDFWTPKAKSAHKNEYEHSKKIFSQLEAQQKNSLGLKFFVENVTPTWKSPEWGFPKGRRNMKESNIACAVREFKEESGIDNSQYKLLTNIEPIVENLIGTNGIKYRHIYYIGITYEDINPKIEQSNVYQTEEIGGIGFFTYDESINLIRSYHINKKKILTTLYMYIINKFINRNEVLVDLIC